MAEILGGEVVMHPPPKGAGTKREHASHDVKLGYGGNDVSIQGSPLVVRKDVPRGYHGNLVQSEPGNIVQMSQASESIQKAPAKKSEASQDEPESSEEPLSGEDLKLLMEMSQMNMRDLVTLAEDLGVGWDNMTLNEMHVSIARAIKEENGQ
jgi:NACalpha-BTF3-like transcription factor